MRIKFSACVYTVVFVLNMVQAQSGIPEIEGPETVFMNESAYYTISDSELHDWYVEWEIEGTGTFVVMPTSEYLNVYWGEEGEKTIRYVYQTGTGGPLYLSKTITVERSPKATSKSMNYIESFQYDENEEIIAASIAYFDQSGQLQQSQSWDPAHNEIFASEPIYDQYNRAVGQTMSAPINRSTFDYKEDFVTYEGADYPFDEFNESTLPGPVDKTSKGTLGWYYSNQNTDEERVAETKFPFSIRNFYDDGSGESKSSTMPGDFHHLQSDRVSGQRVLPAEGSELKHYSILRNLLLNQSLGTPDIDNLIKTIGFDANGRFGVSYKGGNEQALATALDGGSSSYVSSGIVAGYPFEEIIHVPSNGSLEIYASLGASNPVTFSYEVRDVISGEVELSGSNEDYLSTRLKGGIYELSVSNQSSTNYAEVHISRVTYDNYSYSFYDNKARPIASIPPKGTELLLEMTESEVGGLSKYSIPYATYYHYDFQGRLTSMTEPDAGTTTYRYRKDGQIRYSQNQDQADAGANVYSYTNYDNLGRPVESGECHDCITSFANASVGTNLSDDNVHEWIKTYYDVAMLPTDDTDFTDAFTGVYALSQDFVRGAVSSTESEEVQSWYSYDDQGRLTWYLQYLKALDKYFFIQYEYDFLGNVLNVAFQPQTYVTGSEVSEAFWHRYEYDKNQRLVKASTSVDDDEYYEHATYEYFKHGPLKRVVLAEDLQGIDYTYTAQGWLKAINHPVRSLDPGGDGTNGVSGDEFGMTLEYFEGDYASENTPIGSQNLDDDQFQSHYTGNIRSTLFGEADESSYDVNYKEAAYYGHPQTRTYNSTLSSNVEAAAQDYIRLSDGFNSNGYRTGLKIQPDQPTNINVVEVTDGESYMYNYDDKYQLEDATYSDTGGSSWDNAYNVKMDGYDANGNISGIERYDEDTAEPRDDFGFHYEAGTNRLLKVDNYIESIGYNKIGQVTSIDYTDPDQTDIVISYDVTGKVTSVYDGVTNEVLMEIAYDDRGFRMMKRIGDVEEWYVRDASGQTMAIYHKEAGNGHPISQQELPIYGSGKLGMAFKNPDHYKYIYELTDHLGNVRALVTKLGLMATATMELEEDDYERQYFDNLSLRHADEVYNHTNQGLYGALTDPNYPVGPTTTLRVKAGDEINLEAFARFTLTDDFDPSVLTNDFLTALTSSVNGGAIGVEGDGLMQGISDILNSGDVIVNAKSGAPKAYLQYILLNDNFEYVGSDSYAVSDTEDTWQEMSLGTTATADGYLFAYVVNESNEPVYFDDFSFQIVGNRAIRKTDYYPFGAVAKVWEEETEKEEVPTNTGTDLSGNLTDKNADSDWFGDELRVYTTTAILEEQSYAEFTVPTTAGQEYTFSYLYTLEEQVGTGYNYTQLYIDGIQEISDHSSREDSFIQEDVTFLATGAETVFRFSNYFEPALYPGQELNITISHLALKDVTLTEGTAPPDLMQISSSTEAYRYGYQGQYAEQDTITGWNAFELRMYDPLIGRWLSIDPYGQFASPYMGMGNNPITQVDPDGGYSKAGAWLRALFTKGVSTSDIFEVDGEWGFNKITVNSLEDYSISSHFGGDGVGYGYGNPGEGVIRPHESNFFERTQDWISNQPVVVEAPTDLVYTTANNAYVVLQLGPLGSKQNLDGTFINGSELEEATLGFYTLALSPGGSSGPKKGIDYFSSALKGTRLNKWLYSKGAQFRGAVWRNINKHFNGNKQGTLAKGTVKAVVTPPENE